MAANLEDLLARIERLEAAEHEHEEAVVARPHEADRFWSHIPFGAWLKLSGPSFALMALGFGLLWNGQQVTTQRILDLQESTTDRILDLQERITDVQVSTAQQINQVQRETAAQISAVQRETAAQIIQVQRETTDRLLEMQQRLIDLHREDRS